MSAPESPKLCPSAPAKEGALLLGVVNGQEQVDLLPQPLPVTKAFVETVEKGQPNKHFRFANKCVKSGCKQWSEGQCGVIATIMQFNAALPEPSALPACSIRPQCRWYTQQGARACVVCPYIITDQREDNVTQVP